MEEQIHEAHWEMVIRQNVESDSLIRCRVAILQENGDSKEDTGDFEV